MRIRFFGDAALLVEVDEHGNDLLAANAHAHAIAAAVREARVVGVRDIVAAMTSVTIHIDPLRTDLAALHHAITRGADAPDTMTAAVASIEIPVTYGGMDGPDLAEVAACTGLTPDEVVGRHVAVEYRVCHLGFLPGFAYLGMVDDVLRMPRRATPRTRVPAGSVAIADRFSGIYPIDSPGGWHVIGRTSLTLFDVARTPPALLTPGSRVRFVRSAA